jgi:uncharacterized protein (DUF779 family)
MRYASQTEHLPGIVGSASAVLGLAELRRERGPQVIVLTGPCATVQVAITQNGRDFVPHAHHVRIGGVADCPVYADIEHIAQCPHEVIVLDLSWQAGAGKYDPAFVTRPESKAEREQRVFSKLARGDGP